ncbi:MAG: M56 family metallopeptidase [Cellulosilyticaceae bacterium]
MDIVIQMTIYGSVVALVVLGVNKGLDRWLKASWKCMLWLVVLIRFLVPMMPESSFSLFNYVTKESTMPEIQQTRMPEIESVVNNGPVATLEIKENITDSRVGISDSAGTDQSEAQEEHKGPNNYRQYCVLAFKSISVGIALYFIILNIRVKRRMKRLQPITDAAILEQLNHCKEELGIRGKFKVACGATPALVGVFKPTIVLPKQCTGQALEAIMRHELTHYKYKDHWIGLLQVVVLIGHWFNPIVWVVMRQLNQDIEYACDERVLNLQEDGRIYMETLVKLAAPQKADHALVLGMKGNKEQLRLRIQRMMRPIKYKKGVSVLIGGLMLMLAISLLTNQQGIKLPNETRVLVLGHVEGELLADAIMLVALDHVNGKVSVTSIPRDTKLTIDSQSRLSVIEGLEQCKVSELMVYGSMLDAEVTVEEVCVEEIERLMAQEIDYYVTVSNKAFASVMNAWGGLTLDIPSSMMYQDTVQELEIALNEGTQWLNGTQIEGFVRFRQLPKGDLDRIQNQHYFLSMFFEKMKVRELRPKAIMDTINHVRSGLATNMSLAEITSYVKFMSGIDLKEIALAIAEGTMGYEKGRAYYLLNN